MSETQAQEKKYSDLIDLIGDMKDKQMDLEDELSKMREHMALLSEALESKAPGESLLPWHSVA